jgi:hypothetical protein
MIQSVLKDGVKAPKEKLTEHKYPAIHREIPNMGHQYLNLETLKELVRWIDSLNRMSCPLTAGRFGRFVASRGGCFRPTCAHRSMRVRPFSPISDKTAPAASRDARDEVSANTGFTPALAVRTGSDRG